MLTLSDSALFTLFCCNVLLVWSLPNRHAFHVTPDWQFVIVFIKFFVTWFSRALKRHSSDSASTHFANWRVAGTAASALAATEHFNDRTENVRSIESSTPVKQSSVLE